MSLNTNTKNTSVLRWATSQDLLLENLWYSFGEGFYQPAPVGFIPPFQLPREATGDQITEFVIIDEDGVETDITAAIKSAGLTVETNAAWGYDIIFYPSRFAVAGLTQKGHYRCRMTDGTNTWYSETFTFWDDLTDVIKITYWHSEDLVFTGGRLIYKAPFKNVVYVCGTLAKPSYEYEREAEKRRGVNFYKQKVRYKLWRFDTLAPEYLIDALSVIDLHHFVEVEYLGQTYEVDEILFTPKWTEQGDIALIEAEFRTDTVIVTNNSGVQATDYEIGPGSCLNVIAQAEDLIVKNSTAWTNLTTNAGTPLTAGQYVIVDELGNGAFLRLYVMVPSPDRLELSSYPATAGNNFYDKTSGLYYFSYGYLLRTPVIGTITALGGDAYTVTGISFANTYADIYGRLTDASEGKITDFLAGSDCTFSKNVTYADLIALSIRPVTSICNNFSNSPWVNVPTLADGIGFMIVGTDNRIGTAPSSPF